ncbi:hypothetical protein D3C73_1143520 [compost metagenome]
MLDLGEHLVYACFGFRLAQAGTLGHQLCQVSAVLFGERPLRNGPGDNPCGHAIGGVITHRRRAITAEQAVDEIAIGVRLGRHAGCGPHGIRARLHTGTGQPPGGTHDQHRRYQGGDRPGEKTMRRVAEVHLVTVQVRPLHPQAPGNIATQPGSKNLGQQ